jgi:hypothetical protein
MPANKNPQTPRPYVPPDRPAKPTPRRWEYAVDKCEGPLIEAALDEYGARGWELVSTFVRFDTVYAVFKRELQ